MNPVPSFTERIDAGFPERGVSGGRIIILGDVHGCAAELEHLLREVKVTDEDDLVSVGDLICKGPDSHAVLEWAMQASNLRCVLGNHEARLLDRWLAGKVPEQGSPDEAVVKQFGDRYEEMMRFLASWPLYLEAGDHFVVHAGIDPRVSALADQSRSNLTSVRIPEGMTVPWYDAYEGTKLAVFGHWARREPVIRPNAIGLDTGCVYGGSLSALILPEKRLVSVPAAKVYERHAL
jgi:diadenosine tetraphosphatase ApaH/serine/threonine PP2A family protein phosphatase